jgi:hypothetical protein
MSTVMTDGQVARVAFEVGRLAAGDIYRVELSQERLDEDDQVIERLISFAFDTLGMQAIDIRIVPSATTHRAADGNVLEQPP